MISYEPLWATLKKKEVTKYKLIHKHGIASRTLMRMAKNEPTSSETIEKLCSILDCKIEDIMIYIKNTD